MTEASSSFKISKAIAVAMAFLFLQAAPQSTAQSMPLDQKPQHKEKKSSNVYVTLANEVGIPLEEAMNEFDCSDKIYSVVELINFPKGRHELSVLWIDPTGTSRENTQYPFHINQKEAKLWAWLVLSRASGAGMLQWLNPAAGLEEFIGPWELEVRIDGKKIATMGFEVSC